MGHRASLEYEINLSLYCYVGVMKIIQYTEKYRDDMIFMVLQAKDALGRKPGYHEYEPGYMMKML